MLRLGILNLRELALLSLGNILVGNSVDVVSLLGLQWIFVIVRVRENVGSRHSHSTKSTFAGLADDKIPLPIVVSLNRGHLSFSTLNWFLSSICWLLKSSKVTHSLFAREVSNNSCIRFWI